MENPMQNVFIYCDDKSHARRVAVTNFRLTPMGWDEQVSSRAQLKPSAGYTLHGDTVDADGWALEEDLPAAPMRVNFDLVCRKCRRPWTLTQAKLYSALDVVNESGVSELSLVTLASIVRKQSER